MTPFTTPAPFTPPCTPLLSSCSLAPPSLFTPLCTHVFSGARRRAGHRRAGTHGQLQEHDHHPDFERRSAGRHMPFALPCAHPLYALSPRPLSTPFQEHDHHPTSGRRSLPLSTPFVTRPLRALSTPSQTLPFPFLHTHSSRTTIATPSTHQAGLAAEEGSRRRRARAATPSPRPLHTPSTPSAHTLHTLHDLHRPRAKPQRHPPRTLRRDQLLHTLSPRPLFTPFLYALSNSAHTLPSPFPRRCLRRRRA